MSGYDLVSCLDAIDPSRVEYSQWIEVGMALKQEGHPFEEWDGWSRRDAARYKGNGAMRRKWDGFGASGMAPVTGGTIVRMARDSGWEPPGHDMGTALGWDDAVTDDGTHDRIVDPTWVEAADVVEPEAGKWHGWRDAVAYLEALFEPNEIVGYVVDSWDKDGRWVPSGKGPHTETAGDLISRITKHRDDLASSIGFNNVEAGAWIRFNPLDGRGVRNDDVTEFRYALVESDDMAVERQRAIIDELELPVAALVHSGNKSLHAIVHVDAKDYGEYRQRVDFLYRTCAKNGLRLDTQNKNPSRLSRLPGVMRAGRKQWLMGTGLGKGSWAEWREWLDEVTDDLPEPESLADVWDDLPELAPPLIEGVLRQGHKMLLAGPSKAGKSFALIELCVAMAEGMPWMGFPCAQGRVLYVNLELDRASCLHRFHDVYAAMGARPEHVGCIDVWNLRGRSKPMDQLAPSLIRRALKTRPMAVVIDPIYKVITGDENSADQMARFCNQFDKVATELGCAVVYCHHHSKGSQGQKRSMDRASGSGVFSRDPDAMLDLIELVQPQPMRDQVEDAAVRDACAAFMDGVDDAYGWRDVLPPDDQLVGKVLLSSCKAFLEPMGEGLITGLLDAVCAARGAARAKTAWRIEGTLREFQGFDPVDCWFEYPVHRRDETGMLGDIAAEGTEDAMRQKGTENAAKRRRKEQAEKVRLMREAMEQCARDGVNATRANVAERIGEFDGKKVSKSSLRNWTDKAKAPWSPISVDRDHESEGLLVDAETAEMLREW